MTTKKQTYQERAKRLAKTVDIANKIIKESKTLSEQTKSDLLNWGQEVKNAALNPEPQFKKVASIKIMESDFLTYWNEEDGYHIEKFWSELQQSSIDFKRKDTIQTVLKRKKIKDIHEYDNVIDNLVVAEQTGRINKDQALELKRLTGEFEDRQKLKTE